MPATYSGQKCAAGTSSPGKTVHTGRHGGSHGQCVMRTLKGRLDLQGQACPEGFRVQTHCRPWRLIRRAVLAKAQAVHLVLVQAVYAHAAQRGTAQSGPGRPLDGPTFTSPNNHSLTAAWSTLSIRYHHADRWQPEGHVSAPGAQASWNHMGKFSLTPQVLRPKAHTTIISY